MLKDLNHIFCVDDEDDILEVVKLSLEAIGGFTVSTCSGSQNCISAIENAQPNLVILDVMMPNMDGPTTLGLIKKNDKINKIPVIFMTAKVQQSEIDEYLSMGVVGVVSKPFDPMTLPDEIRAIWNKSP